MSSAGTRRLASPPWLSLLGALLGVLGWLGTARAAPTEPQARALAESLFREAKQLAQDSDYEEACPKFAESHRLDPQLGTLLHLATCHEQQGKTASAWAEFSEAAEWAARRNEDDRARLARKRAEVLEGQCPQLVVEIEEPPPRLEVRLDGRELGMASLATPLPVDPGDHEITAEAPGAVAWSRSFTAPPGPDVTTITIPPLQTASRPKATRPATDEESTGSGQRAAGWVIGGVGVVGLVVMAVMGAQAASLADEADSHCEGSFCHPDGLDLHDDAQVAASVSTVAFVVGVVGMGTGLTLLLTAPDEDEPSTAWLTPIVSADGARVSLGVRW